MSIIFYKRIIFLTGLVGIFLLSVSCKREIKPLPEYTDMNAAVVTSFYGDVYSKTGEDWEPVDYGTTLKKESFIKTGDASFCELQLGETAVIRLQENTEILMGSIMIQKSKRNVNVNLTIGQILCKVARTSGNDEFQVKTPSAVIGVRGTEFLVQWKTDEGSFVAVREGRVSVDPMTSGLEKLSESISESDEELTEIINELVQTDIEIGANQELVVSNEIIKRMEADVALIETELQQILLDRTPKNMKMLKKSISKVVLLKTELQDKTEAVSKKTEKLLKHLDDLKMRSIRTEGDVSTEDENSSIDFAGENSGIVIEDDLPVTKEKVNIKIKTSPPDSEIRIDGEVVSKNGEYSKAAFSGEKMVIRIRKAGYMDWIKSITIPDKDLVYDIVLNKNPVITRSKVADSKLIGNICTFGNRIAVVSTDGFISILNERGEILNNLSTGNKVNYNSSPVVAGRQIIFTGAVSAFSMDVYSGKPLYTIPGGAVPSNLIESKAVVILNRWLQVVGNKIIGRKFLETEPVFSIELEGSIKMLPQKIKDNNFLVVDKNSIIHIYDPEGNEIEKVLLTENPVFRNKLLTASVYGNFVYVSEKSGKIVCFEPFGRNKIWESSFPGELNISYDIISSINGLFVVSNGMVFFMTNNGTPKRFITQIRGVSSPLLYRLGKLYFGSRDGYLKIANASTGKIIKEIDIKDIDIEEMITTKPKIKGGKIYAGTNKGYILGINLEMAGIH